MSRKQRRLRVYMVYPFDRKEYQKARVLQQTIQIVYKLGYIPIICAQYISPSDNPLSGMSNIYQTIDICDAVLLCYEEDITERMLKELYAARIRGKPVIRSITI